MRRPAALYVIHHLLMAQLPHLSGRLRAVLGLWVEGTLLGLNGCQDTVTLALAQGLRSPRSWGPGQRLEVEGCFAPLLQWVPTGGRELAQEPLVLAVDPTSKQDDLVALVISVVYRQHTHPGGSRVAWHIVRAQAKGSWLDHFCRLLRLLAPAVPTTVPVHVLCDQGLGSRDLWAQIVDLGCPLGRHPCLRYPPHVTFQPEGQTSRVPVRSLITGPGDLWVGTGRAFRDPPLDSTGGPWSASARPTQSRVPLGRVTPESSRSPYSCQDLESAPGGHPARQGQRRTCSQHNGAPFHVQARVFCGNRCGAVALGCGYRR